MNNSCIDKGTSKCDEWNKVVDEHKSFSDIVTSFAKKTLSIADFPPSNIQLQEGQDNKIRILDVACGMGEVVLVAQELCCPKKFHFIATDFSEEMIRQVGNCLKKKSINNIETAVMDAANMSTLCSDSFDYVICQFAIDHFYSPQESVNEMTRLLKPNGTCVIATWKYTDVMTLIEQAADLTVGSDWRENSEGIATSHAHRFADESKLIQIANSAGLRNVNVSGVSMKFNVGCLEKSYPVISRNPIADQILSRLDEDGREKFRLNFLKVSQDKIDSNGNLHLEIHTNIMRATKF
ncbi:SAM-dependent methyltransferase [Acrasis kona]|uniref:SAM-dependent methyltransferase n=1 Tax=Acrasis kona TaxID=1008807 RepID=A0AAW2Z0C6_9EUKA